MSRGVVQIPQTLPVIGVAAVVDDRQAIELSDHRAMTEDHSARLSSLAELRDTTEHDQIRGPCSLSEPSPIAAGTGSVRR